MKQHAKSLPYETATSGERALAETQRILQNFGCQSFGSMMDWEQQTLIVQFKFRDLSIHVEASIKGYAAAWLRVHPYSSRMRRTKTEHEREAMRVASLAVYSILRDWLKGQFTAIEAGVLTFEGAFLGQIMLPGGMTVLQHSLKQIPQLGAGEL